MLLMGLMFAIADIKLECIRYCTRALQLVIGRSSVAMETNELEAQFALVRVAPGVTPGLDDCCCRAAPHLLVLHRCS